MFYTGLFFFLLYFIMIQKRECTTDDLVDGYNVAHLQNEMDGYNVAHLQNKTIQNIGRIT